MLAGKLNTPKKKLLITAGDVQPGKFSMWLCASTFWPAIHKTTNAHVWDNIKHLCLALYIICQPISVLCTNIGNSMLNLSAKGQPRVVPVICDTCDIHSH